jgi:hypothetical protein
LCWVFFEIVSHELFAQGWLRTMILLISASWIARITRTSYWRLVASPKFAESVSHSPAPGLLEKLQMGQSAASLVAPSYLHLYLLTYLWLWLHSGRHLSLAGNLPAFAPHEDVMCPPARELTSSGFNH